MHSRRRFMSTTAMALGGLVVGCSGDDDAATPAEAQGPPPASATATLLEEVAADRSGDLQVINASFETLTGDDQLFAFGLVGLDNTPVTGADVEVWIRQREGEPPAGPVAAMFTEIPNQPLGLYVVRLGLPTAGAIPLVATTSEGAAGQTTLRVADPETAAVPPPGSEAPVVTTPTTEDLLGFERLCTLDPPCGMHDVSFDTALADGKPVMLAIATPAFCETAICGPTVEVVEGVRTDDATAGDDTVWIHLEVFTDAGQTLAEQVEAWGLPSEPWVFGIDREGRIAGRLDGPLTVLDGEVAALAAEIA